MGRTRLVGAAALPLILILAACGGGATPSPSTASPSTAASPSAAASASTAASPSGAAASPTGSASAEAEYEIKVAAGSGSVTNYLTGEDGKTLYVFHKDTADSGKSVCNAGCAGAWPPFAVDSLDEVKADSGVTGTLSVISRDDGTKQVAYKGMPLYYFGGDSKAGDTNGSAIADWSVATP